MGKNDQQVAEPDLDLTESQLSDANVKGKEWTSALRRALARAGNGDYRIGLDMLASRLVKAGLRGDQAAERIGERIADRLEGKPAQQAGGDAQALALMAAAIVARVQLISAAPQERQEQPVLEHDSKENQ